MIDDDKIYYVGLSDGGNERGIHYTCMLSKDEAETKEWCRETKKKHPKSDIAYLKMTGRLYRRFNEAYSEEYKRFEGNI